MLRVARDGSLDSPSVLSGPQSTRSRWRAWSLALALLFLGVALFRSSLALRLATGGALLTLLAVAIQAGSALAAGIGVLSGRGWTRVALVAFGVGAVLQAIAEVFVYGTWPLLAAVGACLAVAAVLVVLAVLVTPDPRLRGTER
jgi:hypothetical protein